MKALDKIILSVKRRSFYLKSQFWTREQITEYHEKKLIEIVRHSGKNVPYYRQLFKRIDLNPQTFKGLEDITKIPLLDKDILRTRYKDFIADNAGRYGMIWKKTSGSTGTPLNILLDYPSVANKWAATARAYQWTGYRLGNLIFYIKGIDDNIKREEYCYKILDNSIVLNSNRLSEKNCIKIGKILLKSRPSYYSGYARSLLLFSQILKESQLPIHKPKAILCFGETLTPHIRKKLEENYQAPVFDFYSHAENTVMICETNKHNRYIMEDYFYPEIVDEEGNITDDRCGELVGTSFYNYSMPLIRYRTSDIISILKARPGADREFIQVNEIEGRKDDYIRTPDGRYIFIAEGPITFTNGVVTSQYIQDAIDHLTVNLIIDRDFQESYFNDILTGLKLRFGDEMHVDFMIVEELEKKSSGKIPFIINRLKE